MTRDRFSVAKAESGNCSWFVQQSWEPIYYKLKLLSTYYSHFEQGLSRLERQLVVDRLELVRVEPGPVHAGFPCPVSVSEYPGSAFVNYAEESKLGNLHALVPGERAVVESDCASAHPSHRNLPEGGQEFETLTVSRSVYELECDLHLLTLLVFTHVYKHVRVSKGHDIAVF